MPRKTFLIYEREDKNQHLTNKDKTRGTRKILNKEGRDYIRMKQMLQKMGIKTRHYAAYRDRIGMKQMLQKMGIETLH